ncbi:hypothetical protein DIPPA_03282 [Diplonema papillatum]|nr:hypothetical protein DIPPA_03282 [Diplonema papillatum]
MRSALVALGCLAPLAVCAGRTFRADFIYSGPISDFGWTHGHNLGRIAAHGQMNAYVREGDTVVTVGHESIGQDIAEEYMLNLSRDHQSDMFLCTSFLFHGASFAVAEREDDVDVVHATGYYSGLSNFATVSGKGYQSRYLAGVIAGGTTVTQRVGLVAAVKIPEVYRGINAYFLGIQVGSGAAVNASAVEKRVELIVYWIGTFFDEVREREAARRLVALGCDVVMYHTDSIAVPLFAKEAGIHSVGANQDTRLFIGETVLTSSDYNWAPVYLDMMKRSYDGTFRANSTSKSVWYGYEAGVPINHPPSFHVSRATASLFDVEQARLRDGGFDPFCLPVITGGVRMNADGACLPEWHLERQMLYTVDGVTDLGDLRLFGEACGNGTVFSVDVALDPPRYDISCSSCPAGTYAVAESDVAGAAQCRSCEVGYFSRDEASACTICPVGSYSSVRASAACHECPGGTTNYNEGSWACHEVHGPGSTQVLIISCSVAAFVVLVVAPVAFWRVTSDRRRMNRMYSNHVLAENCAYAIAEMRLEDVAYIANIAKPNDIQLAFIQILDNLTEYRKYLPQSLLDRQNRGGGSGGSAGAGANPLGGQRAPEGSKVAIVFTDILQSTNLWEACPEAMALALHLHNQVIRQSMAACAAPLQALRFALDVQKRLFESEDWPGELSRLPPSEHVEGVWNGLRVRIGMHYGQVRGEENIVSHRIDYFGATVNTAARLEAAAAAGTVAVVQDVLAAVKEDAAWREARMEDEVHEKDLGDVALKGLKDPHRVILLVPRCLRRRVEKSMRQNKEVVDDSSSRCSIRDKRRSTARPHALTEKVETVSFSTCAEVYCDVSESSFQHLHALAPAGAVFGPLVLAVERTKGTIIAVFNSRIIAGWNVSTRNPSYLQSATTFANMANRIACDTIGVSNCTVGICSGSVCTGMVGSSRQRFLTFLGHHIDVASEILRLARGFGAFAVIAALPAQAAIDEEHTNFDVLFRPLCFCCLAGDRCTPFTVYQLRHARGCRTSNASWEWSPAYCTALEKRAYDTILATTSDPVAVAAANFLKQSGNDPHELGVKPIAERHFFEMS